VEAGFTCMSPHKPENSITEALNNHTKALKRQQEEQSTQQMFVVVPITIKTLSPYFGFLCFRIFFFFFCYKNGNEKKSKSLPDPCVGEGLSLFLV
jgi:hypothetical protein